MSSTFTAFHRGGSGSPLLCLHGFTDTWRTWELVLPALEREHDVLALTLAGHAGGPPIEGEVDDAALVDAVERAMDEAGWSTANVASNSLGGYVSLQLAARGRADSVVALAPAGGWAEDDDSFRETAEYFSRMRELVIAAVPYAETILSTEEGRRTATREIAVRFRHIPTDLLVHQLRGVAACEAAPALIDHALREGWSLHAERIECPVRVVWGTEDRILKWPAAAARFQQDWLPNADWVVLDDVGHCPQLDVPAETADLILGLTSRR